MDDETLALVGIVSFLIGYVWMTVLGFRANPDLGCLLVMYGPLLNFVQFFKNPKDTWVPFVLMLAGMAIILVMLFSPG